MVKKITLLGATGTIGKDTIDIVKQSPEEFSIDTVIANNNIEELARIVKQVGAKKAVIANKEKYTELKNYLEGASVEVFAGEDEVISASADIVDIFISGAVGFCALRPTMAAIKAGNKIGLANKECLVCAGEIMVQAAKDNAAKIIPIDSEHNSIYQVFDFDKAHEVEKIILTASGGPFRTMNKEQLRSVTPEMAVKHPNWNMGKKISVDSATMMNKGLEVIEAYHLFPIRKNQIDILVHPQSIIHGLVSYKDGSMLAGISGPDMRVPISYALAYPDRMQNEAGKINLADISNLTFEKPDMERFRCLKVALDALNSGQPAHIALNAANEIAVEVFLAGGIGFEQIATTVESVVEKITAISKNIVDDLEEIFDIDEQARIFARQILQGENLKQAIS